MPMKIIIGTRGSKLALWQAKWVKSELETLDKNLQIEVTVIREYRAKGYAR